MEDLFGLSESPLSILSSVTALVVAIVSAYLSGRNASHVQKEINKANRELEHVKAESAKQLLVFQNKQRQKQQLSKYKEPLLQCAFDLQSRLVNIVKNDFLSKTYLRGNDREQIYAIESTLFLIAQFFGWSELVRVEQQLLDLGADEQTRILRRHQETILHHFRSSKLDPAMRVFSADQRAIGELMIKSNQSKLIGYAEFLMNKPDYLDTWLSPVREDLIAAADSLDASRQRLVLIQKTLIELIDFLDPHHVRFTENRSKLENLSSTINMPAPLE